MIVWRKELLVFRIAKVKAHNDLYIHGCLGKQGG